MTYPEVKALVRRCLLYSQFNETNVDAYLESAGVPRAAEGAALDLWVYAVPENEDTRMLRSQLHALWSTGSFALDDS